MKHFQINKLAADYSDWVSKDSQGGPSSLRDKYFSLDRNSVGQIPQTLSYAATWLSSEGVEKIRSQNPEGWRNFRHAAQCRFWLNRMSFLFYDASKKKRSQPTEQAFQSGLSWMFMLSVSPRHDEARLLWFGERLDNSRHDNSISAWDWDHPTPRLAIALHRYLAHGGEADLSDLELGVYAQIFDVWNEPTKLITALHAAADYHVQNLDLPPYSDEDIFEFTGAPYDIFPVEIHAIYRVRQRLGLETPRIDHPLMNTPFGNPPKDIPEVDDPLLNRAIERVREVLPDL